MNAMGSVTSPVILERLSSTSVPTPGEHQLTPVPVSNEHMSVPQSVEQFSTLGSSWNGASPPNCCRCGSGIYDRLVVRVQDKLMHSACVRCTSCGVEVSEVCFSDGTDIYCQTDFYRRFGGTCSGCSGVIAPEESVRIAGNNIYHERCFACALCHVALQTGDKFYIREDDKLLCERDLQKLQASDEGNVTSSYDSNTGKRLSLNLDPHQRKVLEQAYQTNQRPSRHIRQKLSMLTGIDTRLIHSWFRNKRNKNRSRRIRNIRRGSGGGNQDSGLSDNDTANSGSLSGSGDDARNTINEEQYPMNYTSDLSTLQTSAMARSPYSRLNTWLKHVDSLAVDAVPPNIELKASDFTAGGEIRLTPTSDAQNQYGGLQWYQRQVEHHESDTWIPTI
ncbi:LIM/homeobox protein Lhx3-like [Mizuhopecten yessoensis]|uniref:LIM/homeobox protein Lhx3-like n=1 Tax=Mizuhopecten yessoensis TaxID=6573 RepID=UPI000B45F40D|nr:LIM/homeobox protein Lhx3-like [Mizuhopecten yessoensis]